MPAPLEVFSDLQLDVDGESVDVRAQGDEIVLDLPTLRAGRRLLASKPFWRGNYATRAQRLHNALRDAGLTLDVRLTGASVARMGRRAQPGRFETLLNLDGLELHPGRSLRSAAQRRPILSSVLAAMGALAVVWLLVRTLRT